MPNFSFSVRAARAAMKVIDSRIGSREISRSVCQIESTSLSSHRSIHRHMVSTSENGKLASPIPIRSLIVGSSS